MSQPPIGTLGFRVQRYGMMQWGDLFTARQKVALGALDTRFDERRRTAPLTFDREARGLGEYRLSVGTYSRMSSECPVERATKTFLGLCRGCSSLRSERRFRYLCR